MAKNPFTFDSHNPRLVTGVETPSNVLPVAGAIFTASVLMYNKRFFRVDKNLVNLLAFTAASAPASYVYANFFLNTAVNEAGQINNARELT